MAITAAICNSFKLECLPTVAGVHLSGDTYKMALYTSAAALSKATTAYSTSNEVVGTGYTAGGATLAGLATALDTDTAMLDFSDPTWPTSTITARGALIYNSSKSNKAVAVLDFGGDIVSTAGTFTVALPAAAAATAAVRMT
ncbi:MAG TPA: hypothetical protein VK631_24920 [Solirubrobacteraceae bacterium]|nr:hypothetical protein [Solirubrobacteraceae bacterium]